MQPPLKLFMLLLGCTPKGRFTEQHDIFFDIGTELGSLKQHIVESWPEAPKIHIDAWREVTTVDGYHVEVTAKSPASGPLPAPELPAHKLFFINLGGYKPGDFDEYHYKMLVAAPDKGAAIKQAKETAFYKHTGFKGAESHIDDKYGIDVDDIYDIRDILPDEVKEKYRISLRPAGGESSDPNQPQPDPIHLGYFQLHKI